MTVRAVRTHPWDVTTAEARGIQQELRRHVMEQPLEEPPEVVAGIDVSIRADQARAAVALLSFPELEPLEAATASDTVPFPYVPGLLAFREGPASLQALEQLTIQPDVLIFDAHGKAHPRRFGLASHMGVLLDLPSAGCAKSRLCGTYDPPGQEKGSWTRLQEEIPAQDGSLETIGAVVRTRDGVRPVFVSVGHRIDLRSAISLVLACAPRYRLPEPTRWAHRIAGAASLPEHDAPRQE